MSGVFSVQSLIRNVREAGQLFERAKGDPSAESAQAEAKAEELCRGIADAIRSQISQEAAFSPVSVQKPVASETEHGTTDRRQKMEQSVKDSNLEGANNANTTQQEQKLAHGDCLSTESKDWRSCFVDNASPQTQYGSAGQTSDKNMTSCSIRMCDSTTNELSKTEEAVEREQPLEKHYDLESERVPLAHVLPVRVLADAFLQVVETRSAFTDGQAASSVDSVPSDRPCQLENALSSGRPLDYSRFDALLRELSSSDTDREGDYDARGDRPRRQLKPRQVDRVAHRLAGVISEVRSDEAAGRLPHCKDRKVLRSGSSCEQPNRPQQAGDPTTNVAEAETAERSLCDITRLKARYCLDYGRFDRLCAEEALDKNEDEECEPGEVLSRRTMGAIERLEQTLSSSSEEKWRDPMWHGVGWQDPPWARGQPQARQQEQHADADEVEEVDQVEEAGEVDGVQMEAEYQEQEEENDNKAKTYEEDDEEQKDERTVLLSVLEKSCRTEKGSETNLRSCERQQCWMLDSMD